MSDVQKIKLCESDVCTGCMACKQKCKNHAIDVIYNKGFAYPQINEEKCVGCGLCMRSCPVLNIQGKSGNRHEKETTCIAAWNKDENVRMRSSSGGSFSVMAEKVFSEGGVVFGAAWDSKMNLQHRYVESPEELDALRRSKYVQSDTKNTFNEVREFLRKGRKVLYCGTPCQIAGLTAFLGYKDYDNLIKVDVICQGVPSNEIFKKYISEVEAAHGVEVIDANFRSKDRGWRCGLLLLLLLRVRNGGKTFWKKRVLTDNEYYNAFIKEYFMRESCYDCQFKCNHQGYYSDISIADFWRIGKNIPLNVEKYEHGISAVIVNTQKGKLFFEQCQDNLVVIQRTWNEFMTNGGMYPCHKRQNNDEAYEYLQTHSWRDTQQKYFPLSLKHRIKVALFLGLGEKRVRVILKLLGKIK